MLIVHKTRRQKRRCPSEILALSIRVIYGNIDSSSGKLSLFEFSDDFLGEEFGIFQLWKDHCEEAYALIDVSIHRFNALLRSPFNGSQSLAVFI